MKKPKLPKVWISFGDELWASVKKPGPFFGASAKELLGPVYRYAPVQKPMPRDAFDAFAALAHSHRLCWGIEGKGKHRKMVIALPEGKIRVARAAREAGKA